PSSDSKRRWFMETSELNLRAGVQVFKRGLLWRERSSRRRLYCRPWSEPRGSTRSVGATAWLLHAATGAQQLDAQAQTSLRFSRLPRNYEREALQRTSPETPECQIRWL